MRRIYKKIQWKYFVDNKSIDQAAEELLELLPEKIRRRKRIHGQEVRFKG